MTHIHDNIDFVVSAYIVHDDKALLVDHKGLKMWPPVGGHIEPDEDPEQALYREIKEESGLSVRILLSKPSFDASHTKSLATPNFMDIHKINEKHRHVVLIYFAAAGDNKTKLAPDEHRQLRWFSKEDLAKKEFHIIEPVRFYALEALKAAREK